MIHRKGTYTFARTAVAVFFAMALGACGASTYPAPTAQTPDPPTRRSDVSDSGSALPEVVITAPRWNSPSMAKESSSRPRAKQRGG